ncbi:uncharacterized protein HD556DRAFT_1309355 [Suillus plorans]|uniref:Uncharacterized protein n=1 Tax=Suillus plorans TaxID=116603 RepID=A0A9P7AM50_9AGAM|nr:uncharacterized protein HD556DRAFT_1309355 [Suillus plorans]KAG1792278.1 hypothetical protein HD556DRAFT_1309355 [Suillus plorans]
MENGDSECWEKRVVIFAMSTKNYEISGQSNIYAKVVAEYFGSEVHVNKHEALRTMGKHVIALATIGASKTGRDTDRTSARENIRSDAREMSDCAILHACDTYKSVVAELRAVDDARHCLV